MADALDDLRDDVDVKRCCRGGVALRRLGKVGGNAGCGSSVGVVLIFGSIGLSRARPLTSICGNAVACVIWVIWEGSGDKAVLKCTVDGGCGYAGPNCSRSTNRLTPCEAEVPLTKPRTNAFSPAMRP